MKFKFIGGNLCLDFLNTVGDHLGKNRSEYLKSYHHLVSWGAAAGLYTGAEKERLIEMSGSEAAKYDRILNKAVELREILFQMLIAIIAKESYPPELLKSFNVSLTETLQHLQIRQTGKIHTFEWDDSKDNSERIIWEITRSAADLIVGENINHLKVCADNSCGWLFLDTSKNKRRAWCDMKDCGNRNKFRRYYSKNKTESAP